jgi:hypothetical protein
MVAIQYLAQLLLLVAVVEAVLTELQTVMVKTADLAVVERLMVEIIPEAQVIVLR